MRDSKGRFVKSELPPKHSDRCKCFRCTHIAWNTGVSCSDDVKEKLRKAHLGKKHPQTQGENNWNWKGDKVGYMGLHSWINSKKGKPVKCIQCGSITRVAWANKSYEYKRDLDDWMSLCQKCHMGRDAKLNWGQSFRKFPELIKYYEQRKYKTN